MVAGCSNGEDPFWSNLWVADPAHEAAPPHRDTLCQVQWVAMPKDGVFTGEVYADGSVLYPTLADLSRAGYAVVQLHGAGSRQAPAVPNFPGASAVMYGPYGGLVQEIGAAEIYAAIMALRHALPPLVIYTDCQLLVDGFAFGKAWCLKYKRAYVEVWAEFWQVAEDFGTEGLRVETVQGHARLADVVAGIVHERDRQGNNLADRAAKLGAARHPANEEVHRHRGELAGLILEAGRWIARVGQIVSSVEGFRDVEEPPAQPPAAPARADPPAAATAAAQGLAGDPAQDDWWDVAGVEAGHASHRVWLVGDFAACLRCGAYASSGLSRLYRLRYECKGAPPNPSAELRLRRLRQGRHPLGDHFIELPRLSSGEAARRIGSSFADAEATDAMHTSAVQHSDGAAVEDMALRRSSDPSYSTAAGPGRASELWKEGRPLKRLRAKTTPPVAPQRLGGVRKRPACSSWLTNQPVRRRLNVKTTPFPPWTVSEVDSVDPGVERKKLNFVADIAAYYGRSFHQVAAAGATSPGQQAARLSSA